MNLKDDHDIQTISKGFYLAVTNNSHKPNIKYEGIEISTGLVNNIGISRTFYKKLSSPYGNCRNDVDIPLETDSDYYRYTVLIGKYTRNQCFEVCFQYKYAIEKCKCADGSVDSNLNNTSVCFTGKDLKCLEEQRSQFESKECDTSCPESCERVDYSYRISTSSFPTE